MNRSILPLVFPGFILVAEPVLGRHIQEPDASTRLSDVALPPQLDRVLRDYERAWRAGDAAALASLFAEDGFLLQNNRPLRPRRVTMTAPRRGLPVVRSAWGYKSRSHVHTSPGRSMIDRSTLRALARRRRSSPGGIPKRARNRRLKCASERKPWA